MLDLKKLSIIYQTEESLTSVKYFTWNNYLMIKPMSRGDTVYFIDVKNNELVYKYSKRDRDLNNSIFQLVAVGKQYLLRLLSFFRCRCRSG